jgi:uncharacterized protein (TIGR02646 family)
MIFLDCATITIPADWKNKVDAKLPDPAAYRKKARAFERLSINGKRRDGFTTYAPEVLPQSRGKATFPAVWSWKSDKRVKTALAKWSHGKCAYCETLINARRSQHVEHFKPKSLFPSLAYDWDNYFLACNGCNGAKSDKWPTSGGYIRPDQGKPEALFNFEANGGMSARQADSDAERTVADFGLERSGLRQARRTAINLQLDWLRDVLNERLPIARKRRLAQRLVKRAEAATAPYSQALGQNLRRLWHAQFPDAPLF